MVVDSAGEHEGVGTCKMRLELNGCKFNSHSSHRTRGAVKLNMLQTLHDFYSISRVSCSWNGVERDGRGAVS